MDSTHEYSLDPGELRRLSGGALKIAVVAPPWIPVPPAGYGGIEAVVDLLCEQLVRRGHKVTLFAANGSHSIATVRSFVEAPHPNEIGASMYESDHVAGAWAVVDAAAGAGDPFDVIHDHSGFTALAMADRVSAPVVHTVHGPFDATTNPFYRRHGHKVTLVALSRSQAVTAPSGVRVGAVVANPVSVERWPFVAVKQDYLLWMGRMDPTKGAHRAILAARLAGRPLVLAGPIQPGQERYFQEQVVPHLDGTNARYVGVVTGTVKEDLYANAGALLMPIRWAEPFGMVMVEALACGTPVIAFPEGAAAEIVIDGENGLLVDDEQEMARAVDQLEGIEPRICRASAASRYDAAVIAAGYERVYRSVIRPEDAIHLYRATSRTHEHPESEGARHEGIGTQPTVGSASGRRAVGP